MARGHVFDMTSWQRQNMAASNAPPVLITQASRRASPDGMPAAPVIAVEMS
jgi:hypothetical protein